MWKNNHQRTVLSTVLGLQLLVCTKEQPIVFISFCALPTRSMCIDSSTFVKEHTRHHSETTLLNEINTNAHIC